MYKYFYIVELEIYDSTRLQARKQPTSLDVRSESRGVSFQQDEIETDHDGKSIAIYIYIRRNHRLTLSFPRHLSVNYEKHAKFRCRKGIKTDRYFFFT